MKGLAGCTQALLHAISSATPLSAVNCTLAFIISASSLSPSPEHQTLPPTALSAGCPTGASNSARIKLNPAYSSLAPTCPCPFPPFLQEWPCYHLPPRLPLSLILSSNYSTAPSSPAAISLQAIPSHPSLPPQFSGVNFLCPYYLGISDCSTGCQSQFS